MAEQQKKSVLVVEDYADLRTALCAVLREYGYETYGVSDGREALNFLKTHTEALPNLIVLDLIMPEMDGWALREQLKEDPLLASVPVVVLTAQGWKLRTRKIDAAAVVPKPIELIELVNLVKSHSS